jgi:murein DD-endopeptidase MepM/ murein hydrolase activator NlpD
VKNQKSKPSKGEFIDEITEPDDPANTEPQTPTYTAPCDGHIQKDFSEDTLVFSQTMNDHRIHLGIDVAGKLGDPVKAFGKGVIEKIYTDKFMGKTVIISHEGGMKSVYMNLADELPDGIKEGVSVEAGTVIGAIGETASSECADSPHLHFEVRLDGKKLDPKEYITLPSSSDSEDIYEG